MIRCVDDALHFSFLEVERELLIRVEEFIQYWTPRLQEEDVVSCLEDVLGTTFRHLTPEQQDSARASVVGWSAGRVAEMYRDVVIKSVNNRAPNLEVCFQRTLRIPDDGRDYPLPAGLGTFPLRPMSFVSRSLPDAWLRSGGVIMPMYRAEALWIDFTSAAYPFAVKVGAGELNAVSGLRFEPGLQRSPQNYLVIPDQPWLDGFQTAPGVVRQFVCTSVGRGHTVEEQLLGSSTGGIQMEVFPLKASSFYEKQLKDELPKSARDVVESYLSDHFAPRPRHYRIKGAGIHAESGGLGAGGRICQEIYDDPWEPEDWDLAHPCRVGVHIVPATRWLEMTGELPPQPPLTPKDYADQMIPWFDYYRDDLPPVPPPESLAKVKSLVELGAVDDVDALEPSKVVSVGPHAQNGEVVPWEWS